MPAEPAVLRTERLAIRPWRADEADRFFDLHRRVEVALWIGGRPMEDRHEAARGAGRWDQRRCRCE
jgi:hypothetical protein